MLTRRTSLSMIFAACAAAAFPLTSPSSAKQRSAADKALYDKAVKDCNRPSYSSGARPEVNYKQGTYRCVEPRQRDR